MASSSLQDPRRVRQGLSQIVKQLPNYIEIRSPTDASFGYWGCLVFLVFPFLFGIYLFPTALHTHSGIALAGSLTLVIGCPLLALACLNSPDHWGYRITGNGIESVRRTIMKDRSVRLRQEQIEALYLVATTADRVEVAAHPSTLGFRKPLAVFKGSEVFAIADRIAELLHIRSYIAAYEPLAVANVASGFVDTSRARIAADAVSDLRNVLEKQQLEPAASHLQQTASSHLRQAAANFAPAGQKRYLFDRTTRIISVLSPLDQSTTEIAFDFVRHAAAHCTVNGLPVTEKDSDGDDYTRYQYAYDIVLLLNDNQQVRIGHQSSLELKVKDRNSAFINADWIANFYLSVLRSHQS